MADEVVRFCDGEVGDGWGCVLPEDHAVKCKSDEADCDNCGEPNAALATEAGLFCSVACADAYDLR